MKLEVVVDRVIMRSRNAKSIRFVRPDGFDYLPGQWISLTLGTGDKQWTKPLSLSSSSTEDFLEVTKRLTGHDFSNALNDLKAGDKALMKGPYGSFTLQGGNDRVCMLSGGIGITPLRSMIRFATDRKLRTSIVLLHSNRYEDGIPFEEDLDEMERQNPNLRVVKTMTGSATGWKGLTGRIDPEKIKKAVPDYSERYFYVSGPGPMVDAMKKMLIGMGLSEVQIKQENFLGYDE